MLIDCVNVRRYVHITKEGQYSFCTTSDDGSFIYVDGAQIVNNDGLHGPQQKCALAMLSCTHSKVMTNILQTVPVSVPSLVLPMRNK